mgnify:CR=1 FL=1
MADAGSSSTIWPAPPAAYYKDGKKRKPPPVPDDAFQMYGLKRPALGEMPPAAALEEQVYTASTEKEALVELRRLNRSTLSAFLGLLRTMHESSTCAADGAHNA